jgi:large subunit ribosomal protein L7/L12
MKSILKIAQEMITSMELDVNEITVIIKNQFGSIQLNQKTTKLESTGIAEENSLWAIILVKAPSNRLALVKAVKNITDFGLKESKDIVDIAPYFEGNENGKPVTILTNVPKLLAIEYKKQLEETEAVIKLIRVD